MKKTAAYLLLAPVLRTVRHKSIAFGVLQQPLNILNMSCTLLTFCHGQQDRNPRSTVFFLSMIAVIPVFSQKMHLYWFEKEDVIKR